ncbi:MAG: hypothetical protein C4314_01780, partial [Thermoflexus sp.]
MTRLVARLKEEGLVVERPDPSPRPSGRRPMALYLNREAYHLIGVDLGGTHLVGVIANLEGDILEEIRRPSRPNGEAEEALPQLMEALEELLRRAR